MSRKHISGCYIPPDRVEHMARHGVAPEEVHEALENEDDPPLWLRGRARGKSSLYVVLGRTAAGRYLAMPGVVFSEEPLKNCFLPVTARDMDDAERRLYGRKPR